MHQDEFFQIFPHLPKCKCTECFTNVLQEDEKKNFFNIIPDEEKRNFFDTLTETEKKNFFDTLTNDEKKYLLKTLTLTKEEKSDYGFPSEEEEEDETQTGKFDGPSERRQLFTRWRWSYPNSLQVKTKTFFIKYEKKLSSVDKIILHQFQKKYLYHAIDDILYLLKSKPIEQDNLLTILYSPILSLQNNFSIDFFDIWIDSISMNEVSKGNKFLATQNLNVEPFSYITIKLLYTHKLLPKKPEPFW